MQKTHKFIILTFLFAYSCQAAQAPASMAASWLPSLVAFTQPIVRATRFAYVVARNGALPNGRQRAIMWDALGSDATDQVDLSKITVEREPMLWPRNRVLDVVYAPYKAEYSPEVQIEDSKAKQWWNAGLTAAAGTAAYALPRLAAAYATGGFAPIIIETATSGLQGIVAAKAYDTVKSYFLSRDLEAARNGDGDLAAELQRKAIGFQINKDLTGSAVPAAAVAKPENVGPDLSQAGTSDRAQDNPSLHYQAQASQE